jgi:serine protease AprX
LTEGASLTQLADTVGSLGGRVLATLELSDSLLVELPKGVGAPAGSAEIPDTPMKVNGTQQYYETTEPTYRETIGVPQGSALGQGVTVALIDTGVSPQADGLGANVEHVNVSDGAEGDGLGHGTFLAGLIAGTGKYQGVAPAADILDVQVADEKGNTSLWKVLEGLNVAGKAQVEVVNLSLSTDSPLPPSFDPLSRTLERLWDEGVTVVVAAGNDGPGWGTVASPGNTPKVITVGALDEKADADTSEDSVAEFSSRGTLHDAMKPDLVAPGVSLVSTAAPGSIAVQRNRSSLVDGGYMRGSGTSMSAAVVSGAVAALLSENEGLTPDVVKAHLQTTALKALDEMDGAGAGALHLGNALTTGVDLTAAQDEPEVVPGEFGPDERDAERWAAFAALWAAGKDEAALLAAWQGLSPRTKIWAARAWSMAVVANSLGEGREEFEARAWSARAWSAEEWLARAWSARAWSDYTWEARAWSARAWSDDAWSLDPQ